MIEAEPSARGTSQLGACKFFQGDEVGGSNERCPLTSNFDAKKIHEVNQCALLIAIF